MPPKVPRPGAKGKPPPVMPGSDPPAMSAKTISSVKPKGPPGANTKMKKVVKGLSVGRVLSPPASTPGSPRGDDLQTPAEKKPPKTLREVADFYSFPLSAVRAANPGLASVGDDEKIPKGTKLQLPKKSEKLAKPQSSMSMASPRTPTTAKLDAAAKALADARQKQRAKEEAQERARAAIEAEEEEAALQSAFKTRAPESQMIPGGFRGGNAASPASPASPGGKKKGPPKCLQDVADNYNFELREVYEANPTLVHLGPQDRLPVGTKLQLPKRKPTFAQLSAQLSREETVERQALDSAYEREADNFWFLLRLEKKSLLKKYESYLALVKEHKAGAEAVATSRLRELRDMAHDEHTRRVLIVARKLSAEEQQERLKVHAKWKAGMDDIEARDAFFRGTIDTLHKNINALVAEQPDAFARDVEDPEKLERGHAVERSDMEIEHLRTMDSDVAAEEAAERAAFAEAAQRDHAAVEAFLANFAELSREIAETQNDVAVEEGQARAGIEQHAVRCVAHIDELYAERRKFEATAERARHTTEKLEGREREEAEDLLRTWTAKMTAAADAAAAVFESEAAAEDAIHADEAKVRAGIAEWRDSHRAWVDSKLAAQAAVKHDEATLRLDILQTEAALRTDAEYDECRVHTVIDEDEHRRHLLTVASEMHAAARSFFIDMESLTAEAMAEAASYSDKLLEQFDDDYADTAAAVVEEEAETRRNGVVNDENEERTDLARRVVDLNAAARRFFALEEALVKEEESASWGLTQEEDGLWKRMIVWHGKRVRMIEEGKTELEFLEMEEGHERDEVNAANEAERLRISALAQESKDVARRKLNEQSDMYWSEHQARKDISGLEASERKEVLAMEKEAGRKAWQEYLDRMFDELSSAIFNAEDEGRDGIENDERVDRKALVLAKDDDKRAAAEAEAARLLRERLEREFREQQRKERLTLERAHETEREFAEYQWSVEAAEMYKDVAIVEREELVRTDLEGAVEPAAYAALDAAFYEGILQIDRDAIAAEETDARAAIAADEQAGWEAWRKERLAAHYEIWLRESAERRRMQAQDRADHEAAELSARGALTVEFNRAVEALKRADVDGQRDAVRLEKERHEALVRAKKEWEERKWFARKQLGDEEEAARRDSLLVPEQSQFARIATAEGRARRKAEAEAEARLAAEREAELARKREEAEREERERRARQEAIEAELRREREKERQKLLQRQAVQRERFESREATARAAVDGDYDAWVETTTAEMADSHAAAHNASVARETAAKIASLEESENAERDAAEAAEAEEAAALERKLAQRYEDAMAEEHRRRLRAVWNTVIPIDAIDAVIDLEASEGDARRAIEYQHGTAFRSWVDAIAIEERMLEAAGRRRTTQRLLAEEGAEAEERSLLCLLEGLLRAQLSEAFDREVLLEWEVRCTDALHAHAIDTIDAYLTLGPTGFARAGLPPLLHPVCGPRPEFDDPRDRARSTIPSLVHGDSTLALTPRPPTAVLASIASTPGRLQQRLRRFELQGEAGTPTNLYSKMQRFDTECRSDLSTPFSAAPFRSRIGFSSYSPGETLPAILPTPTPAFEAIMDRKAADLAATARATPATPGPRPPPTAPTRARPQLPTLLPARDASAVPKLPSTPAAQRQGTAPAHLSRTA